MSRHDPTTGKPDIWTVDLRRGVPGQVTRDPVGALFPLWSSKGHAIVFASARAGPWNLYERSADGSGTDRHVFVASSPLQKWPSALTRDGQLLFQDGFQELRDGSHVWALDRGGNKSPVPVVQGGDGRVSPDQRWLAYTSDGEVYVTAFSQPHERRWRISGAGGTDPQWRPDGRELYYIDADSWLTAVTVRTETSFGYGTPVGLFRITSGPPGSRYAASADGQRFIAINRLGSDQPRLFVTINWTLEGAKPRPGR